VKLRLLAICLGLALLGSGGGEPDYPDHAGPRLLEVAPFPIGVAYCNAKRNPRTSPVIDQHYNALTSTEFYPFHLIGPDRQWVFSGADQAVLDAQKSGRRLHGHCLLYTLESVCPPCLREFKGDNQQFEAFVADYLGAVLGRYRGRVRSYDLCNELFTQSGSLADTWLRRRFASDQQFLDFIGRCYGYAHAADPQALLFYCDFGQEHSTANYAKGWAIAHQLMRWKRQGIPIHGYSLQGHTNIYRPQKDLEEAFRLAASTGLLIHLSELEVSLNWCDYDIPGHLGGIQGQKSLSADLLERQKQAFARVARAYRAQVPAPQRYGITLWDVGDADSWLATRRFERPTLFDLNYRAKPAYAGLLEGLRD